MSVTMRDAKGRLSPCYPSTVLEGVLPHLAPSQGAAPPTYPQGSGAALCIQYR